MRIQGIIHKLKLRSNNNNIGMRKITGIIHSLICMWMACSTNICTSKAYEGLPRNPLEGSKETIPGDRWAPTSRGPAQPCGGNSQLGAGATFSYTNEDLTRLLDVGATTALDPASISLVPPLDGASPDNTLCQQSYAMKFVLFDLQLVQLKEVDPVGGSFRVEFEMVLHWIDSARYGANGTEYTDNCSFVCRTNSPVSHCCDKVWVPPFHLSGCEINEIRSSTPTPYLIYPVDHLTFEDCLNLANDTKCYWRRLWYLDIDATCDNIMDFHNFPFDVQSLTIDILNPYASRTWFQLTKGFLKDNIDDDINDIDLSPDGNIPGWYLKGLEVSSTCGTSETWKQTFITQDILLKGLNNHTDALGGNYGQFEEISTALTPEKLICSNMEDFSSRNGDKNFTSITNINDIYGFLRDKYEERVNSTLAKYRQCIDINGKFFSWNKTVLEGQSYIPNFPFFETSDENINRSFNILDLKKDNMSKVWFPCAISAVANLTTPGIKLTILIQRYRRFYMMKLILPTIACVAFSFAAFGLHPKELVGRLTVVVPSAIALTALQSLVLSTDLPPVPYIAPSTYIFIFSYLAQVLISFESVLVKCLYSHQRQKPMRRGRTMMRMAPTNALTIQDASNGPFYSNTEGVEMVAPTSSDEPSAQESNMDEASNIEPSNTNGHMSATRKFDLLLMYILGALYIMNIAIFIIGPLHRSSTTLKRATSLGYVSLWPPDSTN